MEPTHVEQYIQIENFFPDELKHNTLSDLNTGLLPLAPLLLVFGMIEGM